ncbi:MAG TPA: hypothetical protein IAD05_00595 [Candidatus Faecousia gallistercoris]|nr:hypothetical protein [Candidatus Faecousia gallistercoris]
MEHGAGPFRQIFRRAGIQALDCSLPHLLKSVVLFHHFLPLSSGLPGPMEGALLWPVKFEKICGRRKN